MDALSMIEELSSVARELGIEVRIEPFAATARSAGGLCRIRGRYVVLLDASASAVERAQSLAEALSGFELESLHVAPEARLSIERSRDRARQIDARNEAHDRPRNVKPLPLTKPGLRSTKPKRDGQT